MRALIYASLVGSSLVACGYSPDLGDFPFKCGAEEPKCPDGYACMDNGHGELWCITTDHAPADAPMGPGCADDSIIEGASKNDTIQTAYATPVASQRNDISFAGVAICPEGDKDTYKIDLTTMSAIEVITSWDTGGPVSVSLLNGGGASINNGVSSGTNMIRAYGAMLPAGTYYAQAYAAATLKVPSYKISIKVTP